MLEHVGNMLETCWKHVVTCWNMFWKKIENLRFCWKRAGTVFEQTGNVLETCWNVLERVGNVLETCWKRVGNVFMVDFHDFTHCDKF